MFHCRFVLWLVTLMLLSACATPINVSSDYDTKIDFSGFKTYRWHELNKFNHSSQQYLADDITDHRIRTNIDDQLENKGFHATTAHGPDLMENAKNAARYMIDWLVETYGLSRSEAYILSSEAVDLKISEIVAVPHFIVSAYVPLSIFNS